jgi:hypothetical protein
MDKDHLEKEVERKGVDFKSSSTSSLLINSTIDSPNIHLLIKGVAVLLHSNVMEDLQEGKTVLPDTDLYYFSEEKYMLDHPELFNHERQKILRKTPTKEDISGFIEV